MMGTNYYRIVAPDGLGRSEVRTAVGDVLLGEVRRYRSGWWQTRTAHHARWGDVPGRPDGWTGQHRTRDDAAQACADRACADRATRVRDELSTVDPLLDDYQIKRWVFAVREELAGMGMTMEFGDDDVQVRLMEVAP